MLASTSAGSLTPKAWHRRSFCVVLEFPARARNRICRGSKPSIPSGWDRGSRRADRAWHVPGEFGTVPLRARLRSLSIGTPRVATLGEILNGLGRAPQVEARNTLLQLPRILDPLGRRRQGILRCHLDGGQSRSRGGTLWSNRPNALCYYLKIRHGQQRRE